MRPPGLGPTPTSMPTQMGSTTATTVPPAPASLATLASQSSLSTNSTTSSLSSFDSSVLANTVEKVFTVFLYRFWLDLIIFFADYTNVMQVWIVCHVSSSKTGVNCGQLSQPQIWLWKLCVLHIHTDMLQGYAHEIWHIVLNGSEFSFSR